MLYRDLLNLLDDHIKGKIYNYLDFDSQAALRLSCRQWSHKSTYFQAKLRPSRLDDRFAEVFTNVRELWLPNLRRGESRYDQLKTLRSIKGLETLHLCNPSYQRPSRTKEHVDNHFLELLSQMPSLSTVKSLDLGCCVHCTGIGLRSLEQLKNLRKLTACIGAKGDDTVGNLGKLIDLPTRQIEPHAINCFTNRCDEIAAFQVDFDLSTFLHFPLPPDLVVRRKTALDKLITYEKRITLYGRGFMHRHDQLKVKAKAEISTVVQLEQQN